MIPDLTLLSGVDIPFAEAGISIHQPSIKEIGLIGEETFYAGSELLTFSKDILKEEDRNNLEHKSNFEILMSIMTDSKQPELQKSRVSAMLVLSLLFPEYRIKLELDKILLMKEDEVHSINSKNFEKFKENLIAMFCLRGMDDENNPTYNPGGDLAKKIVEKFNKRREVVTKQEGPKKISILGRYVSILSVGERKNMNDLMKYTVYQLFDEFKRYELKEQFDHYVHARLAGAKDLKEVDNWKKDIHPEI